jgi:hydroxymethylbilane synthase
LSALRIGTRGSALALAQARWVAERLGRTRPVEIVTVTTAGDVDRAAGDKGRWVGALEAALQRGEIDLAVHSAKDVPGELADGCELVAASPRVDARDVLVGAPSLAALPSGARVGTSALRRRAQLLAARPDLEVVELRGNVDTRLRKLAAAEADALVLAAAGLERLGVHGPVVAPLEGSLFVPAPGQGLLALEARVGEGAAAAADAGDAAGWACLSAERAVVRALGASCHTPVGAHAGLEGSALSLVAFAGLPDGSAWVRDELRGPADAPAALGDEVARRLLAAGAGELLAEAESSLRDDLARTADAVVTEERQ